MTTILRLDVRVAVCPLLAVVALFATAMGSSFAHAIRPTILLSEETLAIYGGGCSASQRSGKDCISSNNNRCQKNGGGTACPANNQCNPDGTQCDILGAKGNSYLCDQAAQGENCSTTCQGGCYTYNYGVLNNGQCLGCTKSGQCGYPICSITTTSATP